MLVSPSVRAKRDRKQNTIDPAIADKSEGGEVSRNRQKISKNKMRRIEFATVWCHREILGRPAARYSAIFVFVSFLCFMLKRSQRYPKVTPE